MDSFLVSALNMLKTIMVYNKQLPRHDVVMFFSMLLLLQCLMNTKADITQPAKATPTQADTTTTTTTKVEKSTTTTSNINIKSEKNINNNHQTNNNKGQDTLDLVNDIVFTNTTLNGEEGDNVDLDESNSRTFNYSVNNVVIVKPVIGQTNYSETRLIKIKRLYIDYKLNVSMSFMNGDIDEHVQSKNNAEGSHSEALAGDELYDTEFEIWNNRRLMDGLLCQNDSECQWIDQKLRCKTDIELNFNASVSLNQI